MNELLTNIREKALLSLDAVKDEKELGLLRTELLGKKGAVTEFLKSIGKLDPEERKTAGKDANLLKAELQELISQKEESLLSESSLYGDYVDVTKPGVKRNTGSLHPITQMMYDLNDAFKSMGFTIFSEEDVSSEFYAFDSLNFPPDHPARESMDTYWIKDPFNGPSRLCLRPHLTGASVRYLKEHGAPARFVYPGRVYRNEDIDAKHERAFFQYEALIVDKDFSFSSGKLFIKAILEKVFGQEVDVRMRSGFFPFVEPGFEIDMKCLGCGGSGCKVCKNAGWVEIMPGGIPHPNVLKSAGLNPVEWSGFYINIGLDRLVMMRYGVDDIRLFHSADLRFLRQFK